MHRTASPFSPAKHGQSADTARSALSHGHAALAVRDVSEKPPDRVELIDAGSLGYGTGPSFAFG